MKISLTPQARRMLRRAQELGLKSADGSPLVLDQMSELLAAAEGFRNVHAYAAALARRDPPALEQECPEESNCDYRLVQGKGCWLTMGAFSVHPYLTDEGVVVDVYAKGAEDSSIASTWAMTQDAEAALCDWADVSVEEVEAWAATQGVANFDALEPFARFDWVRRFSEHRKTAEQTSASSGA